MIVRQRVPIILAQSAVSTSHTGDLVETTLATVTVPALAMGPNGRIEIVSEWSFPSSSNSKTLRIKFGGVIYMSMGLTTDTTLRQFTSISNVNSNSSQKGYATGLAGGFGVSSGTIATSAIDTSASQDITFTALLASAAETITLESYIIKLYPKS